MANLPNFSLADNLQPSLPFGERPVPRPHQRKRNVTHSQSTAEARALSFEQALGKCGERQFLILRSLEYDSLTARQVLRQLITRGDLPTGSERNAVSPRISELADMGAVEAGEVRKVGSDPPASVWKLTPKGELLLAHLKRERSQD